MKQLTVIFLFMSCSLFAQKKSLLIFDLKNGTLDSITDVAFDSTLISEKTLFYTGSINGEIEMLEETPPVTNLFPNTQFTRKRKAAADYDISKYPIRTSVRIFSNKNDTLHSDCSGSMISRKFVLTASHCVSAMGTNTLFYDSLYVCPIFDNGNFNSTFPCSWVQKIYLFRDRKINGEDFALLELNDPIGEKTGWVSMGYNNVDTNLQKTIFYKFSYPAVYYPALDSNHYNGDTLYYNYGKADRFEQTMIGINNTNGIPGESGSSIIAVANNLDYTSYGVLSFSTDLMHSRFNNLTYHYLESVIHNDLFFAIHDPVESGMVTIFPNPASDRIHINDAGNRTVLRISLIDAQGREIWRKTPGKSEADIDITAIPEGSYLIRICTADGQHSGKLIIRRE